jgi:hypothetical protein
MKTYLIYIGCEGVHCFTTALDRVHWQVLVNTIMILRVQYKTENFLNFLFVELVN